MENHSEYLDELARLGRALWESPTVRRSPQPIRNIREARRRVGVHRAIYWMPYQARIAFVLIGLLPLSLLYESCKAAVDVALNAWSVVTHQRDLERRARFLIRKGGQPEA